MNGEKIMGIKNIKLSNFKSFKKLGIELGELNILIGANASGKSNFIQVFKFLRDITNYGLDNAISMQGGIEYFRNINIGPFEYFSLEITLDQKFFAPIPDENQKITMGIRGYETIYKFALKFKEEERFEIYEDKLTQKFDIVRFEDRNMKKLGDGEIIIFNDQGKLNLDSRIPEGITIKEENIFFPQLLKLLKGITLEPRALLIQPHYGLFLMPFSFFRDILIFDFDPKLPKMATPITGKAELEEDGSNLSIVLKNIIENEEKKRKFSNLVKDLLPFIDDLGIEKFADKSFLFKLREIYAPKKYLPGSLISDGTINVIALIIALYFTEKSLIIIEEPERNVHPYLISKVVEMMKDASKKKQIIVSTHNPEIVKHVGSENILLVSRDKEGFSVISRPHEKETVKEFLKNELGIEDLYVQNLL